MKLKTLKDIETSVYIGDWGEDTPISEFKHKLKAEAIKWVKENLKLIDKPKEDCPDVTWNYSIVFINNWIKHFFNITEEDLQ